MYIKPMHTLLYYRDIPTRFFPNLVLICMRSISGASENLKTCNRTIFNKSALQMFILFYAKISKAFSNAQFDEGNHQLLAVNDTEEMSYLANVLHS